MLLAAKLALSLLCLGLAAHGLWGWTQGRVYCKGRWYRRAQQPGGFRALIGLYMLGAPLVGLLVWRAA